MQKITDKSDDRITGVVLSGVLVLAMYHLLIERFKLEYFRRVTAVGYSCVVFGWMTILSVKQPSSKLDLFGFLSLPISFAPFESLIPLVS